MSKAADFSTILFTFLVIVAAGGMACAGELPEVQPGLRVRATIVDRSSDVFRTRHIAGIFAEATDSAIVFQTAVNEPVLVVAREDVLKLEESAPPFGGAKGALIGFGVGAGIGALVGFASGDDPPGMLSIKAESKAGAMAVLLGTVGALIGLAAGHRERWQAVEVAGLTLELEIPAGQYCGLVAGLRF
ncbi:MAG: hypothetical protein IH621_05200 [Krumholzibacteria bacterium]|nr:hypothetical protein [Candidatus Krumholzibacteria bacterium]